MSGYLLINLKENKRNVHSVYRIDILGSKTMLLLYENKYTLFDTFPYPYWARKNTSNRHLLGRREISRTNSDFWDLTNTLLSLCHRNKISCFTTIGSSGSHRTKSASMPMAIFPLRWLKRLSLAGSSHITRTTSCREKPRLDACDQKMDKPTKTICDGTYRSWPCSS